MSPSEFFILWLFVMTVFAGMLFLIERRKLRSILKPAVVRYEATPFLITNGWSYVRSLCGKAPQKRPRSD